MIFNHTKLIKKKAVYARHEGMRKKKNIPTINTNGLRIKELHDLNSKEFNLKEEEGISSRIKKIWKTISNVLIKDLGIRNKKKVIINDPKTYNSLSFDVLNSLLNTFKKLDNDNFTKVIVLEGAGKGFSAGHNLKEVKNLKKRSKYLKLFNLCSKLMLQIVEGRKPVIAKVHGAAYAAGCQLVASCDLAYSTKWCKCFATPGVNIGLFCSTPMVAVSRKVNRKRMMRMLFNRGTN